MVAVEDAITLDVPVGHHLQKACELGARLTAARVAHEVHALGEIVDLFPCPQVAGVSIDETKGDGGSKSVVGYLDATQIRYVVSGVARRSAVMHWCSQNVGDVKGRLTKRFYNKIVYFASKTCNLQMFMVMLMLL